MPSSRLPPKVARFLGFQTATTPLLLFVVWLVCLWFTRPNYSTEDFGGIDLINTAITWTALTVVFSALGAVNILFSRQLFGESKGKRRGVKTW